MTTALVLPAYRSPGGSQLWVWCEHENRWHYHGAVGPEPGDGDGERSSHCACPCSPLGDGYAVSEVGPLTRQIEREHRERRGRHTCPEPCPAAA